MIQSINSSANLFLNGLSKLQSVIDSDVARVSSGFRISQPSDAPDQISPLLQLQASLSHNQAVAGNLNRVQAELTGADQAVSSALQLLDEARSVASQGVSSTSSAATRNDLAQQVQALQQSMVGLANTQVAGRYVFSGDQDSAQPYALDLNQASTVPQNGVDRLLASPTATRQIEVADRSSLNPDQTAQNLFDHRNADDSLASDNVFAALNSLRTALTNNDQAGIAAAQTSLQTAQTYLNAKEIFYGTTQDQITAATNQISTENTGLQTQISAIRDTAVAATAIELTSAETNSQAALSAEGKRPNSTLFDFLA